MNQETVSLSDAESSVTTSNHAVAIAPAECGKPPTLAHTLFTDPSLPIRVVDNKMTAMALTRMAKSEEGH